MRCGAPVGDHNRSASGQQDVVRVENPQWHMRCHAGSGRMARRVLAARFSVSGESDSSIRSAILSWSDRNPAGANDRLISA